MALRKIAIFLDMAEYVHSLGKPMRPRDPKRSEPAGEPRAWAYDRFPAARAAREAGGGPYRICSFDAHIRDDGFMVHDYYVPNEGIVLPGLADDMAALAFVRALVQTDLLLRVEALLQGGAQTAEGSATG